MKLARQFRWYHATRILGFTMVLYELLLANGTPERGTIILAGCGILGFDYVARNEKGGKGDQQ